MNLQTFEIEWKGRVLGSFTLADIRARLAAGEISRLHRVQAGDGWRPVGEWIDQLESNQRGARANEQAQMERELSAQRNRNAALEDRLQLAERRAEPVPAPPPYGVAPSAVPPPFHHGELPQMSGLAVAALVFGILSAVLFCASVVLISERMPRWLSLCGWGISLSTALALLYGHIALSAMKRDDAIGGRCLALAGILIAYAILAVTTFCIIYATLDDYRPFNR